jgi:uncharacterized protein (TIGR03435 family)
MRFTALPIVMGSILALGQPPSFEVASVKPQPYVGRGGEMIGIFVRDNTLTAEHVDLNSLVRFAYNLRDVQLSGGPSWAAHGMLTESELFQVIAKAGDPPPPMDQFRRMLQTLLADRFQLKVHHMQKDLPAYNLVVAKSGLKLKHSSPDAKFSMVTKGNIHMTGTNVPVATLLTYIELYAGRPVFDRIGLAGNCDFDIQWVPDNLAAGPDTSAPSGPSLFTALQEQLGLKLEPGMAPFDTVVIDHVERPSEN